MKNRWVKAIQEAISYAEPSSQAVSDERITERRSPSPEYSERRTSPRLEPSSAPEEYSTASRRRSPSPEHSATRERLVLREYGQMIPVESGSVSSVNATVGEQGFVYVCVVMLSSSVYSHC